MNEKVSVEIQMSDGAIKPVDVEIRHDPQTSVWKLILKDIGIGEQSVVGDDLFLAMVELRKVLERSEAQLLCAGARPEVFPSGMSRGMGGGRKAYVTRIGEPARRSDIVDIFDYATPESVVTVEQQADFHAKWAESMRRR